MRSAVKVLLGALVMTGVGRGSATAQSGRETRAARKPVGELSQNVPNPPGPDTRFTFTVGDHPQCTDTREYRVTIRIYNVLAQVYAIPVLQRSRDDSRSQAIDGVRLKCGEYTAYWNGKERGTGRGASPGVYRYTLEVDGRVVATRTMTVK